MKSQDTSIHGNTAGVFASHKLARESY